MKKNNRISTVILIAVFLVGLSLLLYPTVSDYWNSFHQSQAIATYTEQVAQLEQEDHSQLWQAAVAYNEELARQDPAAALSDSRQRQYESLMDPTGSGIMGYVHIPSIRCTLPIYHGTDEAVLQVAVGHLPWSSLPVGGPGTHCVISGHRGLPSAKLFTDLDRLSIGDFFTLQVLGETLTYQVDQILVVLPSEMASLAIEEGQDYCTMVTCTPYGINSHRLLVRGRRVDNALMPGEVHVTSDAIQVKPLLVAPVLALPLLALALVALLRPGGRKSKGGGDGLEKM